MVDQYDVDAALADFATLEPGWDSYGAIPITPESIEAARAIGHKYPGAWLCPIPHGGVQLEWHNPPMTTTKEAVDRDNLQWEIEPDGTTHGYLLVFERGEPETRYEERHGVDPSILPELLGRIGIRVDEQ